MFEALVLQATHGPVRVLTLNRPAALPTIAGSFRSCPAQKPRPLPVMSTARTSVLSAAAFRAASSWLCISAVKLFRAAGRCSVITQTGPSWASSTVVSGMRGSDKRG